MTLEDVLQRHNIDPSSWESEYLDLFLSNKELTPFLFEFYSRFDSSLVIENKNFSGKNLTQTGKLTRVLFLNCEFYQSVIPSKCSLDFYSCKISDSLIEESDSYVEVDARESHFLRTDFQNARILLGDSEIEESTISKSVLSDCIATKMTFVEFKDCEFPSTILEDKSLKELSFSHCKGEIIFKDSDITGMTFKDSEIYLLFQRSKVNTAKLEQNKIPLLQVYDSQLDLVQLQHNEIENIKVFESTFLSTSFKENLVQNGTIEASQIKSCDSYSDRWSNLTYKECQFLSFHVDNSIFLNSKWNQSYWTDSYILTDIDNSSILDTTFHNIKWTGNARNTTINKCEVFSGVWTVSMNRVKFSKTKIKDLHWEHDIVNSSFDEVSLTNVDFSLLKMKDLNIKNSEILKSKLNSFQDSIVSHTKIYESKFYGKHKQSEFLYCDMLDSRFLGEFHIMEISNSKLLNIAFMDDISLSTFQNNEMPFSRFYTDISKSVFENCKLSYSSMEEINLIENVFQNCDCTKISFLATDKSKSSFLDCENLDTVYLGN